MRLLNLKIVMQQLQTDFTTRSSELGGCENMNPNEYECYRYHFYRTRRQMSYYLRKCDEQR